MGTERNLMDTRQINRILTNDPKTRGNFLGTFPCDQLPTRLPRTFSLVVNTDKSTQNGLHWQSIYRSGDSLFFFDSYGRRPEGDILAFCRQFRHIYYNAVSHQLPTTSTCGGFAIYHVHMQSRGVPFRDIVDTFLRIREDDKYISRWLYETYQFVI